MLQGGRGFAPTPSTVPNVEKKSGTNKAIRNGIYAKFKAPKKSTLRNCFGINMLSGMRNVDYSDITEYLPAFICVTFTIFANNIANGICVALPAYLIMIQNPAGTLNIRHLMGFRYDRGHSVRRNAIPERLRSRHATLDMHVDIPSLQRCACCISTPLSKREETLWNQFLCWLKMQKYSILT